MYRMIEVVDQLVQKRSPLTMLIAFKTMTNASKVKT